MIARLLLLIILLPVIELAVLIWISQETSLRFTIGLVLATGFGGMLLSRWQGWLAVRRMQQQVADRQMPTDALLDSMLIFAAGVLLVIPGVLTDICGALLLIPPTRNLAKRAIVRYVETHVFARFSNSQATWSAPPRQDRIIDVRVIEPTTYIESSEPQETR